MKPQRKLPEPFDKIRVRYYQYGVPASPPNYASPEFEYREFSRNQVPHEACFVVRVRGRSMEGAGIPDGWDVVVDSTQTAPRDGAVVVAFVDGEGTLKRIRLLGERIMLEPDGFGAELIDVTRNDVRIAGTVIRTIDTLRHDWRVVA